MSGQFRDPGPLGYDCDPLTCTDRVGGEHSDECGPAAREAMKDHRLPHCTNRWGDHHPLCRRDGQYCSKDGAHDGSCTPHGKPDLTGWAPGEITEAFGR